MAEMEGTIVVRTADGAKYRIWEKDFDPQLHTKIAETTAKREAAKAANPENK